MPRERSSRGASWWRRRNEADVATTGRLAPRGLLCLAACLLAALLAPDAVAQDIRVRSLTIEGLDSISPPVTLPSRLPLSPGSPYTTERLELLETVIENAFAERGYPYAEVEVAAEVDATARAADVRVTISPGSAAVFGPIEIRAEAPIREIDVLERLGYEQGEPFRPSALQETVRRLRALPITGEAIIQAVGLETGAPVVPTIVHVPARRTQAFEIDGTLSSARCLELIAYWRNRYFLGAPRLFSFGLGSSNLLARVLDGEFPCTEVGDDPYRGVDYFVDAEVRQPWPGDPSLAVGARLFAGRQSIPQVYVWRGFGADLQVAREWSPAWTAIFSYSPYHQSLQAADLYFCGNFGLCDEPEIDDAEAGHWLSPVEAEVYWTPAGLPRVVRPPAEDLARWLEGRVWAYWLRAAADAAARVTASDYTYLRASAEAAATRFFGFGEIAFRVRPGAIASTAELPPQVRFFSGGFQTVRGADQNMVGPLLLVASAQRAESLGCAIEPLGCPAGLTVGEREVDARPSGGDLVLEANIEGRIWASSRLQLAAFVDYGTILRRRGPSRETSFELPRSGSLLSPGVGVRILSPVGPIRIDVALDTRPARKLPLFTEDPDTGDLIFLGDVVYDPYGDDGGAGEFWRRLKLHVAMAQPF